jgi:hypothetical protein
VAFHKETLKPVTTIPIISLSLSLSLASLKRVDTSSCTLFCFFSHHICCLLSVSFSVDCHRKLWNKHWSWHDTQKTYRLIPFSNLIVHTQNTHTYISRCPSIYYIPPQNRKHVHTNWRDWSNLPIHTSWISSAQDAFKLLQSLVMHKPSSCVGIVISCFANQPVVRLVLQRDAPSERRSIKLNLF